MEDLRPDALADVADRVVAWHRRQPLACRIDASDVQSIGYVGLPYVAGSDDAAPLRPAFDEDFAPPLAPRRVARWAARHGAQSAQPPRGGPVRSVAVAEPPAGGEKPAARLLRTVYVLTAEVGVAGRRSRVLLSPASGGPVLGRRVTSRPRLAVGAGFVAAVAVAIGLGAATFAPQRWWDAAPPVAAASAPDAAVAPGVAARVEGATSSPVVASTIGGAADATATDASLLRTGADGVPPEARPHAAAAADASAPAAARIAATGPRATAALALAGRVSIRPPSMRAAALADLAAPGSAAAGPGGAAPVDVEPTLGRIDLPHLRIAGLRDDRPASAWPPSGAARATAAAASAATTVAAAASAAASAPDTALAAGAAPVEPPTGAAPATAAAASAPSGPAAFALTTRPLRTRTESELTLVAMKSLLRVAGHGDVHVDLVAAGDDWQVVGWPFAARADAEQARGRLAARGLRLDVVSF